MERPLFSIQSLQSKVNGQTGILQDLEGLLYHRKSEEDRSLVENKVLFVTELQNHTVVVLQDLSCFIVQFEKKSSSEIPRQAVMTAPDVFGVMVVPLRPVGR